MQLKVKHFIFLIYCGLILRMLVAVWNGFFGPSPGADLDAQGLYNYAVAVSQNLQFDKFSIGYWPYTNVLGVIFHFTVPSLFLGSVISCFAWLCSAHLLIKSLDIVGTTSRMKLNAVAFYVFYPSSILFTSVTLREPFQLLLLSLCIYTMLKIYYQGNMLRFFPLIIYIGLMGVLHGAMLVTGIGIFGASLVLYAIRKNYKIPYLKILGYAAALVPLIIYLISLTFSFSYDLSDGILIAAQGYQEGAIAIGGRTDYKSGIDLTSTFGLIWFAIFGFFQYLFEPFPWHVGSSLDLIVMLEAVGRFYLILLIYKQFRARVGSVDPGWLFVLLIFIVNEFVWSLGTVNWGTAMRHHVPASLCLLIVAFSFPSKKQWVR